MVAPSEKRDSESYLMNVKTEVVKTEVLNKTKAEKSFNKDGKIINENLSPLQLRIGDVADNRLLLAIKKPELKDGEVRLSFFDKRKFIPLKLADGDIVLVNISNLAARLHLSENDIKNKYMNDGYLNTASITERAKEVQIKLREYDNIINQKTDVTALKISQKDFEKVVRTAITHDLDEGKKIEVGWFKRVKFIASRDVTDESKPILLLTKIKVLGHGAFAKVSEFKNLASPNEALVTKRATKNDSDGMQIKNEIEFLNYLWSEKNDKEPLVGIQPRPKAFFKFNKKEKNKEEDKIGFIITKHDGDLYKILKNDVYKKNIKSREAGALQLLKGLEYMQEKDIVHGDIKPGNIGCKIGGENDNPKIQFFFADFGDARKTSKLQIRKNKEYQKDVGNACSPSYTCPRTATALKETAKLAFLNDADPVEAEKQVAKYKELQFKRDVYSTGLTLYVLLTGDKNLPKVKEGELEEEEELEEELDLVKFEKNLMKAGINREKIKVIMDMVEPDPEKRITAKQACETFAKI